MWTTQRRIIVQNYAVSENIFMYGFYSIFMWNAINNMLTNRKFLEINHFTCLRAFIAAEHLNRCMLQKRSSKTQMNY